METWIDEWWLLQGRSLQAQVEAEEIFKMLALVKT